MNELNEHEKDKLLKLLRNAYIELCRAEKLLKGLDNDNRQSNTDHDEKNNNRLHKRK